MSGTLTPVQSRTLEAIARNVVGVDLLLLFGSRARVDHRSESDWDFGYLGDSADAADLLARLVEALGTDRVDLVDLARASGLLRFRAARDGITLFEGPAGIDLRFRLESSLFWCDMAPLFRQGYDALLADLRS